MTGISSGPRNLNLKIDETPIVIHAMESWIHSMKKTFDQWEATWTKVRGLSDYIAVECMKGIIAAFSCILDIPHPYNEP